MKSTPNAVVNVEEAAALVEQAQHLLERACQKLSSVRNGAPLWRKVGKITDSAHRLWYEIDNASRNRAGMSLDSECPRCCVDLRGWKIGDPPHSCRQETRAAP